VTKAGYRAERAAETSVAVPGVGVISELQFVRSILPALLGGAELTVVSSLLGVVFGVLVGIGLAVGRVVGHPLVGHAVRAYVSFARGTPLFVQILVIFFVLPALGLDIPKFAAGVIALSLNSGAYISEMIRGGLSAVPRGQIEAARSLGLRNPLIWRHVLLPQVFQLILPPLTVEFMALVKASALLSVIGVAELTRISTQVVAASFKPVEVWITTGTLYFLMCYAISLVSQKMEQKTAVYRGR
jgi:polar amino acid transport system permease protein